MDAGQISALTELLNYCRRALRSEQVDVREWQRLRGRTNRALVKPGRPARKPDHGMISDLLRGVPVSTVAGRYKVSRGTVYRVIGDHPELAKMWEAKGKRKKQPDPAPVPVPDPAPARPTKPPLPDVLLQFLVLRRPNLASRPLPPGAQRLALRVVLKELGLVRADEFDALTDEELVARVTAYQSADARRDGVDAAAHADGAARPRPDPQVVFAEFLARHKPEVARRNLTTVLKRMAVVTAMVGMGLGSGDDLKLLSDDELANRVVESEGRGQASSPTEST